MCQKGNGLCLIECGLFDVGQTSTADGTEPGASPPTCANLPEHSVTSNFLSLCPLLVLYLSRSLSLLPEEAFSFQRQSLEEEKESLAKQQKECTAKRYL